MGTKKSEQERFVGKYCSHEVFYTSDERSLAFTLRGGDFFGDVVEVRFKTALRKEAVSRKLVAVGQPFRPEDITEKYRTDFSILQQKTRGSYDKIKQIGDVGFFQIVAEDVKSGLTSPFLTMLTQANSMLLNELNASKKQDPALGDPSLIPMLGLIFSLKREVELGVLGQPRH